MAATLTRDGELTLLSFPIEKTEVDADGNVLVYGKASDGTLDSDSQIIDPEFAAKAIRDWLNDGANVRVQHNPQRDPAGVGIDMDTDDEGGTWVKSKIIEPVAQKLVLGGALRAYSVGIARPQIVRDVMARGGRIKGGQVVEISLVDRPANKNCSIQLVKMASDGHAELSGEIEGDDDFIQKALSIDVAKVGPEGFVHGWIKVGAADRDALDKTAHKLSGTSHSGNHEAASHLLKASDIIGASDKVTPRQHEDIQYHVRAAAMAAHPDNQDEVVQHLRRIQNAPKVDDTPKKRGLFSRKGDDVTVAEKMVTLELPSDVSVAFTPADLARVIAMKSKSSNVGEDRVRGGVDRDDMPSKDFAGRDRSFPVHSPGDVSDAAQSLGRAGEDNYDKSTIKENIKDIAHRKGPAYEEELPESWKMEGAETGRDYIMLKYGWTQEYLDQFSDQAVADLIKATKEMEAEVVKGACTLCHGTGKIREGHITCPRCHGDGKTQDEPDDSDDNASDDSDDSDTAEKSSKPSQADDSQDAADDDTDDDTSEDGNDGEDDNDEDDVKDDGKDDAKKAATKSCKLCGGSGKIREGNVTCPKCGGSGAKVKKSVQEAEVEKDWTVWNQERAQGAAAGSLASQPAKVPAPAPANVNAGAKPAKPAPKPKPAPPAKSGTHKPGEDDWHAAHRLLSESKHRALTANEKKLVAHVHGEHVAHEAHLAHEKHLAAQRAATHQVRTTTSRPKAVASRPVASRPKAPSASASAAANHGDHKTGPASSNKIDGMDELIVKGKAMCVKCSGAMKAKHKFCPNCGAPAGGVGEVPEKTGVKKSAVPNDTVSGANDARPIPPHREPDGAMMEEYEHDNQVPDDDGATQPSAPTRLEEPMLKGDATALALTRVMTSGAPHNLGILHDMTCPAFSPASVAKCYPQRNLAAEIDEGYWQRTALDMAASRPFPEAAFAAKLGHHAVALKSALPNVIQEAHEELHKAFSDANPGPGTAPTPASCTPGRFQRPYLAAGHAAPSPAHGMPNSTPLISGSIEASQFHRGPLDAGHAAPSPANGSMAMSKALDAAMTANNQMALASSLTNAVPHPMPPDRFGMVAGVPNISKGRTFYSNNSKDQTRQAMQAIHDHLANTFPDLCAMKSKDDDSKPAEKAVSADDVRQSMGIPVPAQLTKSADAMTLDSADAEITKLEGELDVDRAARKAAKRARKQRIFNEMLVKEAALAQDMLPEEGLINKAATATEPVEEITRTEVLIKQIEMLREVTEGQTKMLKKQARMIDELTSQPDPAVIAYRGVALERPPLYKSSGSAVPGQNPMADVAERTRAMMLNELEVQFRTSADPALREAAWRSIINLRGVGNV